MTLQEKIDANFRRLCEFHFDGYQAELDTWTEINKAIQEFREQIKTFNTECDCPLCNERTRIIKNVLALLGEQTKQVVSKLNETIQQKVDNYPNHHVIYKKDLNKALQEFRKQIDNYPILDLKNVVTPAARNAVQEFQTIVLALIGEKK